MSNRARALQKVPQKNDTRVRNNIVEIFNGRMWVKLSPPQGGVAGQVLTSTGGTGGSGGAGGAGVGWASIGHAGVSGPIVKIDLKFKCDACEKSFGLEEVGDTYGHEPYRLRSICMKCYMRSRDKMYGVKSNVDLEDTLYGKK